MALRQIVAPSVFPVTVAEAKSNLRIEHDAEDSLLEGYIAAATGLAEVRLRRQFITATWQLRRDSFPTWKLRLDRPPVQAVTRIEYIGTDGVLTTLSPDDYLVDIDSEPGTVEPAFGKCWPIARCQTNAVTVEFTAGYGDDVALVPQGIRQWILLAVGELHCKRELTAEKAVALLEFADSLLTAEGWGSYP